jgi:Inner centromere protein, ARK binding region/SAP domain
LNYPPKSFKRRLGPDVGTDLTSSNAVGTKKLKSEVASLTEVKDRGVVAAANYSENVPPSSIKTESIFKPYKQGRPAPMQKPNSNLSTSIRNSQNIVPLYPDAFSSHPQYLSIMAMKVPELRSQLRLMKLETGGLKKELQQRLLAAISCETGDSKKESQNDIPIKQTAKSYPSSSADNQRMSISSADSIVPNEMRPVDDPQKEPKVPTLKSQSPPDPPKSVAALVAEKEVLVVRAEKKDIVQPEKKDIPIVTNSFVKSTAALFSPQKLSSSLQQPRPNEVLLTSKPTTKVLSQFANIKNSFVKSASSFLSTNAKQVGVVSTSSLTTKSSNEQEENSESRTSPLSGSEPMIEDMHAEENNGSTIVQIPSVDRSKPPAVKESAVVSKGTDEVNGMRKSCESNMPNIIDIGTKENPTNKPEIIEIGIKENEGKRLFDSSTVKDKQKQLAEARKQRLEEMRNKTKPAFLTTSLKAVNVLHDYKSNMQTTSQSLRNFGKEDDKKTLMTAKIREKHAALKGNSKPPLQIQTPFSKPDSTSAIAPSMDDFGKSTVPPSNDQSTNTGETLFTTQNMKSPCTKATFETLIRSPMDTYQISDREDSDSDESDDSDSGPKKKIPTWAQKENLLTALKNQYDENCKRLDPDTLFPEVDTCDLEAIFEKKRSRFKKRTSSGNWSKDRVTSAEKKSYKRMMGFDLLK